MRNKTMILVGLITLISCKEDNLTSYLEGEYYGDWADTSWEYKFKKSGKFFFESRGHYGFIETSGIYKRIEDSLFLYPQDTTLINDKVINSYFIIDGDSCIIDYHLTYDYCKSRFWSKKRAIKFPQVETSDDSLKDTLRNILTDLLETLIRENNLESRQRLVLKEFYQIDGEFFVDASLNSLEGQIEVLTSSQIFENGIKEYVEIEQINLNDYSAQITLNLKLRTSEVSLIGYYIKEKQGWNRIL